MSQTYTWPAEVKSTPPVGGATSANQVLEIAQLTAINTNTAERGQQPMSGSVPVVVASDQSAIPITVASLPLPAGAATQATLASIDTKLTSPLTVTGPLTDTQLRATPVPISGTVATGGLTDTQLRASAVPVSVASVPLPTGAATEATLSALNAKVTAVNTGAVVVSSSALPTGAATSANQTTANTSLNNIDTKTPALGQAAMAASVPVVIASNQSSVPTSVAGKAKVNLVRNDYGSINVTTAAYVQLIASTAAITNLIEIFDSSGQTLVLALGAAASEVDQLYINPGGNGQVPLNIPAGTRVSIKAVTASATSGYINLNLYS